MKVIFLDIDGVLNGHKFLRESQSCNIDQRCVKELNRIIKRTGAKVVLSSAWRYMIHGGAMTLIGFGYMLRTHGFSGFSNLTGVTVPDEQCPWCDKKLNGRSFNLRGYRECCSREVTRAAQIDRYRVDHGIYDEYVIIDDEDHGFEADRFVRTKPNRGLTRGTADEAIRILE